MKTNEELNELREQLTKKGYRPLNLNNVKWFGYNEEKEVLIVLNRDGYAKTYSFKGWEM